MGVFVVVVAVVDDEAALTDANEPLKVNEAISTTEITNDQFRYMNRLTINHLFNLVIIFPVDIIDLQ